MTTLSVYLFKALLVALGILVVATAATFLDNDNPPEDPLE